MIRHKKENMDLDKRIKLKEGQRALLYAKSNRSLMWHILLLLKLVLAILTFKKNLCMTVLTGRLPVLYPSMDYFSIPCIIDPLNATPPAQKQAVRCFTSNPTMSSNQEGKEMKSALTIS
jgi:hypothetical protein